MSDKSTLEGKEVKEAPVEATVEAPMLTPGVVARLKQMGNSDDINGTVIKIIEAYEIFQKRETLIRTALTM